jgi:uncharacterized protein with GYD domain
MARYLIHGSYTRDGIAGVAREGGSGRVTAVKALIEGLGGRVESFDFAFGKDDFYTIVDMPSHVSVAAAAIAVGAAGGATTQTTVLLTPAEMDEAARTSTNYRRPGG